MNISRNKITGKFIFGTPTLGPNFRIGDWENCLDSQGNIIKYKKEINLFKLTEVRKEKISDIKSEASKRIADLYPDYKQRNITGEVLRIQTKQIEALKAKTKYALTTEEKQSVLYASNCEIFIQQIRTRSNELEASLDSMTLAELEAFDPTNDSNWT